MEGTENLISIYMTRQALLQPHTWFCVMVITSAFDIHFVEPKKLEWTFHLTFAANGVISFLPLHPFRIPVSNTPAKGINLSKNMVVAYVIRLLIFVMTISSTLYYHFQIEASESLYHSAVRNKHLDSCEEDHNIDFSKALQAKYDTVHNRVGAVHYTPFTNWDLHIGKKVS